MNRGRVQIGDLLVVKDGATTGKVSIVNDNFPHDLAVVNEHVFICRPLPGIVAAYLFNYLFSDIGQKRILEHFKGSAQGGINQGFASGTKIPVAPIAEQRRIVAQVEALLVRVHAAKARVAKVPAILKRFRQSVLSAACSGRLTADWREAQADLEPASVLLKRIREERKARLGAKYREPAPPDTSDLPELPGTWQWAAVEQIAKVELGGTPSRKEESFWNGDIHWVSSGEVANNRIRSTRETITEAGLKNSNAKIYPRNTVLIAMIGEGKTRGQSAMLEIEATTNQNVAGLVFDTNNISPVFVWHWALGQYEQNRSGGRGGMQPALNSQKIRALVLSVPPLAEQKEIVKRVEALLQLADAVEKRAKEAVVRAETLSQAVLAKAFRGELVPTEAELARREGRAYETAAQLLERIRRARASAADTGPTKKNGRAKSAPARAAKAESSLFSAVPSEEA